METPEVGRKYCRHESCERSFASHQWGKFHAQKAGWFLQRNGDTWCPEHTPEWVAAWRANKKGRENGG